MRTTLYVANLQSHADVRELERAFSRHGVVLAAQVFELPDLFNRNGGFGIVEMGSEEEAANAMESLDATVACGTTVAVRWATAREQTASGHPHMFSPMNITDERDGYTCP